MYHYRNRVTGDTYTTVLSPDDLPDEVWTGNQESLFTDSYYHLMAFLVYYRHCSLCCPATDKLCY